MRESGARREVVARAIVRAPIEAVWDAWTTEAGARTFFAPACRIELRPGGAYEMLFDLDAEPGMQGGEGNQILALQPPAMLRFSWNAPPELPAVRGQRTHVRVQLRRTGPSRTRVTLRHGGWGEGGEWELAFAYFERAWSRVVLPRLVHRFESGPIDWDHPPDV